MKCLNCNKELNNPKAKFCSDKCRMSYKRRTITRTEPEQNKPEQIEKPEQNNPNRITRTKPLKNYTAQELYDAIKSYPRDTWVDSPEKKQLDYNLDNKSLKELQDEGYWIPNKINNRD